MAHLAASLVGLLMLGFVLAPPVSAHATLLFADPGIDGTVPDAPIAVTLVFDEPVTLAGDPVQVTDVNGSSAELGSARQTNAARVITVPVRTALVRGVYTVRWQAVSDDGDPIGGAYRFVIGPILSAPLAGAAAESDSPGLPAATALRWLLFVALAASIGGLVGVRIARPHRPADLAVPAPPLGVAAVAGLVASTGLALLVAGNGSLWRGATHPSLAALTDGRPGRLALVELFSFLVSGSLALTRSRRWAVAPLAAVVLAEGLRAHAATAVPGWGALLTGVHLLAASVWIGALVQVLRTAAAWRGRGPQTWKIVRAYARLASWLFATVVVTGTATALVLVPLPAWTSTAYGRTLLVKLALVAAVAVLAVLARRKLSRARSRPEVGDRGSSTGWAAGLERAALGLVLAVTALLVSLAPPRTLGDSALPVPPPPTGLAVPVGARAGQIGVGALASAGQLVVRLTAPTRELRVGDAADGNRYRIAGSVTSASGTTRKLTWRGCGAGCFVAPVRWAHGVNQVGLRAKAVGWAGGAVSMTVPWPEQPGAAELRRAVTAMREVNSFVLFERVTSDSRSGPGKVMRLPLAGADFLSTEPYGTGMVAQAAVVRSTTDKQVTLRLGFPSERAQTEMVLDADGRILRETLTAPYHQITRTFLYPHER